MAAFIVTMSTDQPLPLDHYEAIADHNYRLSGGAKKAIAALRAKPRSERTDIENGMVDYWVHVIQALNWSTKIAAQRARIASNGS